MISLWFTFGLLFGTITGGMILIYLLWASGHTYR